MKKSPVEIGIAYENKVVEILQSCGLTAYRTNKANESDPEQYKAGFDGGVDIIAKYSVVGKTYKDLSLFTFVCLVFQQYNYTFHELRKQLENQVVPIQIQSQEAFQIIWRAFLYS